MKLLWNRLNTKKVRAEKRIMLILCLFFPFAEAVRAQDNGSMVEEKERNKWYKPDYFKVQYAGNIGFMSLGLGYTWWKNNAQTDFIYGFVPYDEGEAVIHTFSWKNTFSLYNFNLFGKYNLSPTLGFSLSIEPGENSYLDVPSKYPEGYYSSNSFYACLNAGLRSNFKFKEEKRFSSIDVYAEINTVADYAFYNLIAKEDHSKYIYSFSLGVNVFF